MRTLQSTDSIDLPVLDDTKVGGWWIDDRGNWRGFINSANDTPDGDPFSCGFDRRVAFRKFGLVRAAFERRQLCIQWDVSNADRAALDSLIDHIERRYRGPIRLRFRYGGWCSETFPDSARALERLKEVDRFHQDPAEGLIAVDRHALSEIDTAKPLLQAAYHAWRADGQHPIDGDETRLRRLFPYLQIFEERADDKFLVFRWVGQKSVLVRFLGAGWAEEVIGSLFHRGHEDHEFEDMIRLSYDEVRYTGTPIFEHIRALTNMTETESEWFSYQRLLLPCQFRNGHRGIAVMTAEDQNVSIPFLNASHG